MSKPETKEKPSSLEQTMIRNGNDSGKSKPMGNFSSKTPESQGSANPFIKDQEKMKRIHEV